MYKWNQLKFRHETIGKTRILLRRYGCLICALCTMWGRFYRRKRLNPAEVAKTWKFTKDGLLIWRKTNFDGMKFEGRFYGEPDKYDLHKWVRSKRRGMVLEVDCSHWVWAYYYPLSIGVKGLVIIDPLGGKVRPLATTGYKVTGWACFTKKDS